MAHKGQHPPFGHPLGDPVEQALMMDRSKNIDKSMSTTVWYPASRCSLT
jgi:hypothetical protein